jgi:glycosyltransferase involved in cell wall biosynthesis
MKRVLVVITTAMVPYGGLTSVMMNLYRQIDQDRLHIDFASTNPVLDDALAAELKDRGSAYYPLGNRKKHLGSYIHNLSTVLKNGNYDIIHVHSNSATALLELKTAEKHGVKKRIVHNHTSICDHKLLHRICKPVFQKAYTDAIACSKKAGDWIFGEGKFLILNNGSDVERYRYSKEHREQIRSQYGIMDTTVVLGHVGKIYKPKNHHFLIQLFADYHKLRPDSLLLLVGDGDMREEIETDAADRGLSDFVVFAGMQRAPEKYLSAMDVFVFPSIWEGMPLSMIEAQASGIPCLASDTIDESVAVTANVLSLSIHNGSDAWVAALQELVLPERSESSDECINSIKKAGFDARSNAIELERVYLE